MAGLISGVIAVAYRVYLGGSGVLAGTIGIGLSVVGGIVFYKLRHRVDNLFKLAIACSLLAIWILPGFMFVGDFEYGWELTKRVAFPYSIPVFIGLFLGSALLQREDRHLDLER